MKADVRETTLTERKVVRRGLIAGLAGLGAAVAVKLTGAGRQRPRTAVASSSATIPKPPKAKLG